MSKRKVMGRPFTRLDGVEKAAGRARYNSDLNKPGMLHAVMVGCPHAHAKVHSIDVSAAESHPGVAAVRVMAPAGTEVQWAGYEVAAVAATTEIAARDAAAKIRIDYEVLPHIVNEADLKKVQSRAKAAGEQIEGDPDQAVKESGIVVSEGTYGIPTLQHSCLESHGNVVAWTPDNKVEFNPSTQSVTSIRADVARALNVPAANVHVHQDHIGGGFGSKFQPDRWGVESAQMSKTAGGKPVKVFLDRSMEQVIAGCRPSGFATVKMAAKKDGSITLWDSQSWASGGIGGGGSPPIPYVFTKIPNQRKLHSAISLNTAPIRAWRAPNHQQASYLTCAPMEDLAAKLSMDPLDLFLKNVQLTPRADTYERQLKKAAELADWKKLWKPRGSQTGSLRRGLGIGVNTWGGAGHDSTCRCNIHADGTVEVELGSQDLGTGTRTIISQVAAESLGLHLSDIKVKIGDTNYPPSGTSGGSTTVGGVSSSTRKATLNALDKLFGEVAGALGSQPDQLEAVDGKIQVKGTPSKSLTWKAACQKLGVKSISETGSNVPKEAAKEGLNTGGVGGVQIADVTVDMETGVAKMNRLIAVQDIGLVINPRTAESQVFGACIMSICGALMEERIMDDITGRMLNADMEYYKLAGIKDIGEIIVHIEIDEQNDKRGVIGLGEPPAVGGIAAISNAVSNAVGVRVPTVPMTPMHILNALNGRKS